jgi:hypothetical protein
MNLLIFQYRNSVRSVKYLLFNFMVILAKIEKSDCDLGTKGKDPSSTPQEGETWE